jgi:hypothetical protein
MPELWERLADKNESSRAFAAFCIYRDLTPKERSIDKAYIVYLMQNNKGTNKEQIRNKAPGAWNDWSTKYDWVNRAKTFDDFRFQKQSEIKQSEIDRIIADCGYAGMHERVKALAEVADILKAEIKSKEKLYLFGKLGETFNKDLIDQYRGTLEDIAKEVGGRVVRTENKNENNNTTITKGYVTVSPDMWDIIKGTEEDDSNSTPK